MPYLCPYLVNYVAAGQITHFVRVTHSDIKARARRLLKADTWLILSP